MKKLKWTTIRVYVDIDTGEILHEHTALTLYTILKKSKKHNYNEHTNEGQTLSINECRRSPQTRIFE